MQDKFIYTKNKQLKDELIRNGYKLLNKIDGFFILENNPVLKFNFGSIDKSQFILTNKLFF